MPVFGGFLLLVSFAASLCAVVCLITGRRIKNASAPNFSLAGYAAGYISCAALALCCAILVGCFLFGDTSLSYVVHYRSDSSDACAWLYKVAGLWAGREGSLLLWAFLSSLFGAVVVSRGCRAERAAALVSKQKEDQGASHDGHVADNDSVLGEKACRCSELDDIAAAVVFSLVATFAGVLIFSEGNNPFAALPPEYLDGSGNLVGAAALWGMSALLEHWGMAIHPPLLFIGYAGFAVPFAYAFAALLTGDASNEWVKKSRASALAAWLFLTAGIAVGAVWAYSVLGWGGYWGWDAVENASLLPWLCGISLCHSFIAYVRLGVFKRWTVFAACLSFSFVALDAFVTRSGVIGSVHAFDGDEVSFVLFLALAAFPCLLGFFGLIVRWEVFSPDDRKNVRPDCGKGSRASGHSMDFENTGGSMASGGNAESAWTTGLSSKAIVHYLNNLIVVVMAALLAYVTLAPALPTWMPFGGCVLPPSSYDVIAAPVGITYLGLLGVSLAFLFRKGLALKKRRCQAFVLAACSSVLFCALTVYQFTVLVPRSSSAASVGAVASDSLFSQVPSWCCNGLATVGFLVAAILISVSFAAVVRGWRIRSASAIGGAIAHAAMALLLAGLIGSTFYAVDEEVFLPYHAESNTSEGTVIVAGYEFSFIDMRTVVDENRTDLFSTVELDVLDDGKLASTIAPAIQMVAQTQQQYLKSAIVHRPLEDVVVVYKGISGQGPESEASYSLSFEIMVNPFVSFLWLGFGVLMVGVVIALCQDLPRFVQCFNKGFVKGRNRTACFR